MEPTLTLNLQESRDFGTKMNATYFFLRVHFKDLGKSLLFFAAPFVLLGYVLYHEVFARIIELSRSSSQYYGVSPVNVDDYYASTEFYLQVCGGALFILVGGVFTISTTYAYLLVYEANPHERVAQQAVWRKIRSLFWLNFGTMFIYLIAMVLITGLLLIPIIIAGIVMTVVSPFFSMFLAALYILLFFAFSVYFSLLFYIRDKERIGLFAAFARLRFLTKQQFWNTVLLGCTNLYVQVILSALFLLPWYIFLSVRAIHNLDANFHETISLTAEVIGALLMMIYALGSVLLTALPLLAMAMQYYHLVELKEAKGLLHRIDHFGQYEDTLLHEEDY